MALGSQLRQFESKQINNSINLDQNNRILYLPFLEIEQVKQILKRYDVKFFDFLEIGAEFYGLSHEVINISLIFLLPTKVIF